MLLPYLVARDWDKKNPDLNGKEKTEGSQQKEACNKCGQELDDDLKKKR